VEVVPRIPLIPGITDSEENLAAIVSVLRGLGASQVGLLPYNPLGLAMYPQLGKPVPDLPSGFATPEREKEVLGAFHAIVQSPPPYPGNISETIDDNRTHFGRNWRESP